MIQFGLLALAFYISLTRISDFKHHPTDVLAGNLHIYFLFSGTPAAKKIHQYASI